MSLVSVLRLGAARRRRLIPASLVFLAACSNPSFAGPQIQDPPSGFFFDANSTQGRNVFPSRTQLRQGAWWSNISNDDEHSTIFLTTYAGDATAEDVEAARRRQEDAYGGATGYGALERVHIDGRSGWGWLETQRGRAGDVVSLEFKAVIPYDTVTHVVEFHSSEPRFMDASVLREVVGSFAVGRREWNVPLLALVGALALVFGGMTVRGRR